MKLFLSKQFFSFKIDVHGFTKTKLYLLVTDPALREIRCFISSHLRLKSIVLSPPCGKFVEYLIPSVLMQSMIPFLNINNDKIHDNCFGKWLTTTFKTAGSCIPTTRIQWLPFTDVRFANFCSPYILVEVIDTNTTFFFITHIQIGPCVSCS